MEKLTIKNRKDQNVVVVVDTPDGGTLNGLAFVMHGLSGFKEQPHIEIIAQAFQENGYVTVCFDTTNTFGESDGDYADATVTNYYEDLEDVITWAAIQSWYREPFCLAGHSLGGICSILYAEKYPQRVKGIAPLSTVVSGKLMLDATPKEEIENWEKTGWLVVESKTTPGLIKRLKGSFVSDSLKYDVMNEVEKLTMPVLLIVGSQDESTSVEQQQLLYDALLGQKEIHVIEGATHTFRETQHLAEIKQIVSRWIQKLP